MNFPWAETILCRQQKTHYKYTDGLQSNMDQL